MWRTADQFDPAVESPSNWMVAMARNRAIDIIRKEREVSFGDEAEGIAEMADKAEATAVPTDTDRCSQIEGSLRIVLRNRD